MRKTALTAAALAVASLAAATPAAASSRFYGVVWDRGVATASPEIQSKQFTLMRRSGVRTVRRVFSWAQAQPVEGEWPDFGDTDAFVERAARRNIEILPIVMYAPRWARLFPDKDASPPRDVNDYANFLSALVFRYGPDGSFWSEHPDVPKRPLRTWQVWNEPQLPYQWAASDWEASYGKLLAVAYDRLKQLDPSCHVVLAGATNYAWDALESLYDKGGIKGHFDIAALHPYTGSARRVVRASRLFRRVLRAHGDGRRHLWITELAWPASRGRVKPPSGLQALPTTSRGMARRLTRAFKLLRRSRVAQRAYWYTWASEYRKSNGIFGYTGLQRFYPGSGRFRATPAFRAFRRLAR